VARSLQGTLAGCWAGLPSLAPEERIFGTLLVVKDMKASYEVRIGNLMNEGEAKELIR